MIDEDSDWMSFHEAVTYVEVTLHCYRGMARQLLRKAVNNMKVKTRTPPSPMWLVSVIAGQEVTHSDYGESVEVCRKDVVEFCLEFQRTAIRSSPPKKRSALWNNITSAIVELWGNKPITERAKDRDAKIHHWLDYRKLIRKHEDVTRTIQKVLKAQREGQG